MNQKQTIEERTREDRSWTVTCDGDDCFINGQIFETEDQALEEARTHRDEINARHDIQVTVEYAYQTTEGGRWFASHERIF